MRRAAGSRKELTRAVATRLSRNADDAEEQDDGSDAWLRRVNVACVFGPGDLRLREIDPPRAGPRDVVLRVGVAGICGSDLGFVATGGIVGPVTEPVPIGHELAGTVAEAGSEVTSVKVGDRVAVNPLINLIGNGSSEGGFCELLLVRDVAGRPQSLVPLPDSLSMEEGALAEPLAVGIHAISRLGAKPGDKVAIFGAGPIGLASLTALRHRGVADVVVFDLSAFRRERAIRLGAAAAIDPRETSPRDALIAAHGAVPLFRRDAPATTHFLEASGAPLLPDIVSLARAGATICVASVQKKPVTLDFMTVMAKEIIVLGSLGYPSEFPEALDLLCSADFDVAAMISHTFAGEDFLEAFRMAQDPDQAAKVLVRYDRAAADDHPIGRGTAMAKANPGTPLRPA